MDFDQEIGEIKDTLRILDEKVGQISRSIRAYVDFLAEKRLEQVFGELQQEIGQRLLGLESRVESLERSLTEKKKT